MKLTNNIVNIFYLAILVLIIASWWFLEFSLWWIALPTILWISLKVLGSIFIQWNFYTYSHCRKKTEQKWVTLTFDDGPDEKNTPKLLDLLDEFQVKATFFVIGQKMIKHPDLIKMIHKKGHFLGNHSFSHAKFFDLFNYSRMFNELLMTREYIYKLTGIKTKLFRPPYGVTNPNLAKAIRRMGFYSIGWNVRSLDTIKTSDETIRKLKTETRPGSIVLLHDTTKDIVQITRLYLEWLQKNQYSVISLSQLLSINVYE
jgi:peptidoglycan/xylan/chitin deacetylase (PgdA/CDA1 family)